MEAVKNRSSCAGGTSACAYKRNSSAKRAMAVFNNRKRNAGVARVAVESAERPSATVNNTSSKLLRS